MTGLRCRRLELRCIVHYFDFLCWRGVAWRSRSRLWIPVKRNLYQRFLNNSVLFRSVALNQENVHSRDVR